MKNIDVAQYGFKIFVPTIQLLFVVILIGKTTKEIRT